ncbi:4-alpha-glucanotransferase [Prevotella sp. PINT]|uniref:4-alpha-glucanotransferase n=1 Tax=Palleniella intestinalis TaxID=2736291 RepID=UPI00155448A4|nr:4-alpha-glucanotransferase [Palleniella intestinalis]NPD81166.1 4-alpha-glucanotransferase [Palleniella intestinalis]
MNIELRLSYKTKYGETPVVNITGSNKREIVGKYAMATQDGYNWACKLDMPLSQGDSFEYHYAIICNDKVMRTEWLVTPHRLDLAANAGSYRVEDSWIDMPEDAHLYSSAFTDAVAGQQVTACPPVDFKKALCLKVRAPQLGKGQRLALIGSNQALGAWDIGKTVPMTEHSANEWVAWIDASDYTGKEMEFKFVALSDEKDATPMWETCFNRTLFVPAIEDGCALVQSLSQTAMPVCPWRGAGTVIPVFSLRSEGSFGVGDFGDLKMLVDWAAKTHQSIIQVLPINDTTITHTWQDSYPYNSISIFALHPQYTDLRQLPSLGDAKRQKHYDELAKELNALPQIDYERVNDAKINFLKELFAETSKKVLKSKEFDTFFEANKDWLVPYAAFCHFRDMYGTAQFNEWPDHRSLSDEERREFANPATRMYAEVSFWYFVQFNLDKQMRAAHEYARAKGVILKGDIPIGISRESVEAWVEPKYFNLNGQAGAPPDAFSTNGQNWGFPTYNWEEMMKDGCSWWVRRFSKMAQYFDAYRIDHVLGFFRIWEIPANAVHGLLGQFSPSLGMTREEIESYGLWFQEDLFTKPFITDWVLDRMFNEHAGEVKELYLNRCGDRYEMKPEYDTQRKVEAAFRGKTDEKDIWLRDGLYALISDVLFLRDHKDANLYHPRIAVQTDFIYESLWDCDKAAFNRLYNDYFYRRNNDFWYHEAMKKLPKLTQATRMLVCAEDLGMVPECVAPVMNELKILSLEIQSMPKDPAVEFGYLERNPYRSVCTISTHDMSTLRQWWDEDTERAQKFYNTMLQHGGCAPHPLPGWLANDIVTRHLHSPSMLCLLSLHDWLATDEGLRLADADAERINIPANPRHYWRYRMHLTLEQLMAAEEFNNSISSLIMESGRQ